MKLVEKLVFDGLTISGNVTSDPILIDQIIAFAAQSVWTGTPTGDLIIEKSNDKLTWFTEDTNALGGAGGSDMVEKSWVAYKWLRFRYAFTGSTGVLTTRFFAKG